MNQKNPNRTLVIGGRELMMIVIALALLSLAAVIFVMGAARLRQRAEATTPLVTATSGVAEAPTLAESDPVDTPVLAPTMIPTPATLEHVVQAGESLTSIAILYNVDLSALVEANNLTEDSVILPGATLTVPLVPGNEGAYHEVQPGEALIGIAQAYGVSPDAIQKANNLPDANSLFVGQRLYIPGAPPSPTDSVPPALPPTAAPVSGVEADLRANGPQASEWPRSILSGNLEENYPLIFDAQRFTLHYQPDTYPANHLDTVVEYAQKGLDTAESALGVRLEGTFDIYVAGTLFEYPSGALRGLSQSRDRKVFILADGSGTSADNAYFFAHEITHLIAWNTWGQPSTSMLSEGLATWVGELELEKGGFLPYQQLCLAIDAAGEMSSMVDLNTDFQAFKGHIRDPFNYFGSACFISYLVDAYGLEPMSQLYHTSDFNGLYDSSLAALNQEWRLSLQAQQGDLTLDAQALKDRTLHVSQAYAYVFNNYNGTETIHLGYAAVDRARVALWQGKFEEVDQWLQVFTDFTGFTP